MNSHGVLTVLQSENDRMCLAGVYAHEETGISRSCIRRGGGRGAGGVGWGE